MCGDFIPARGRTRNPAQSGLCSRRRLMYVTDQARKWYNLPHVGKSEFAPCFRLNRPALTLTLSLSIIPGAAIG